MSLIHTKNPKIKLVFIHGAGDNSEIWKNQIQFFENSEAVTLPGHSTNKLVDDEGKNTTENYAIWLHEYLKAEGEGKRVILVGHSMGAAITLTYALMFRQEYLAGIALAGGGVKMRVSNKILEGVSSDLAGTLDFIMKYSFGRLASDELKNWARSIKNTIQPEVLSGDFIACNNFDVSEKLNELPRIPTLIIGGTLDKMVPIDTSRNLAESITAATFVTIEESGHYMFLEKPQEFNQKLDEFVSLTFAE